MKLKLTELKKKEKKRNRTDEILNINLWNIKQVAEIYFSH